MTQKDIVVFLTPPLVKAIQPIKERLYIAKGLTGPWHDPFEYIASVIKVIDGDEFFKSVKYEKLGSMGFKVSFDNCPGAKTVHARKIIGHVCAKAFFIILLLRSEFPGLNLSLKYSVFTKTGSASEIHFK